MTITNRIEAVERLRAFVKHTEACAYGMTFGQGDCVCGLSEVMDSLRSTAPAPADDVAVDVESWLTPEEEDELVARINGNPNLHPAPADQGVVAFLRNWPRRNQVGKMLDIETVENFQKAADTIERQQSQITALVGGLEPFARIAELDIGEDESDIDLFRPLTHNRAPAIEIGHLRKARALFTQYKDGGSK